MKKKINKKVNVHEIGELKENVSYHGWIDQKYILTLEENEFGFYACDFHPVKREVSHRDIAIEKGIDEKRVIGGGYVILNVDSKPQKLWRFNNKEIPSNYLAIGDESTSFGGIPSPVLESLKEDILSKYQDRHPTIEGIIVLPEMNMGGDELNEKQKKEWFQHWLDRRNIDWYE